MTPSSLPASTRMLMAVAVACAAFCVAMAARSRTVPTAVPTHDAAAAAAASPAPIALPEAHGMPNAADPAWSRPLFFGNRQPRAARLDDVSAGVAPSAASGLSATLTGVMHSPAISLASLRLASGKAVRVPLGADVPEAEGWRLVSLGSRSAVFRNHDDEVVLKLDPRQAIANAALPNPPMPANAAVPMSSAPPAQDAAGEAMRAAAAMSAASTVQAPAPPAAPPPSATPAAMTEQQQVEAVRRRIEEARRQLRQPTQNTNPN